MMEYGILSIENIPALLGAIAVAGPILRFGLRLLGR